MNWESWFKVAISGLPLGFTIFGVWLYWGQNPVALLAPNLAFWAVVIAFYVFTHTYVPGSNSPFFLAVFTAVLWLVASITSHNLAQFLGSRTFHGALSVLTDRDFWYSYVCSGFGFGVAVWQFLLHEPNIVAQVEAQKLQTR